MDRELGHKLIDSLYNSGNLSLKECGDKRDKLNELKEDQIEIFLTSLPNAEHFLPEIIYQISQIKEAEEVKLKMDRELGHKYINILYRKRYLTLEDVSDKTDELNRLKQSQIEDFLESLPGLSEGFLYELTVKHEEDNRRKVREESLNNKLTFGENLSLSILTPVLLFFLFSFFAWYVSESFSTYPNQGKIFDFSVTWWVWIIYLFFCYLIQKRFYKRRVNGKYFENYLRITLYHLSTNITIVAIIIFWLIIRLQYGDGEVSQIAKSSRDGFIFYTFFIVFLAPTISWLIYYLVIKKGPALTKVIKDSRKIKDEKNQVVKRSEVIKQIKEAKELLDLGVLTQAEYDELIKKLKPIILNN